MHKTQTWTPKGETPLNSSSSNNNSHIQDLVIYFFPNFTHKTQTWNPKGERPLNSSISSRAIKPSSQSTAGVRLRRALCQPRHRVQECWVKTILLSQTSMLSLFFIQNLLSSALVQLLLGNTYDNQNFP
jgi:hypothetical protein